MTRKKVTGTYCICGKSGDLSFEHVPPKAAYNKDTVIEYSWDNYFTSRKVKGKPMQGGTGSYTLCENCNNNTGAWYGGEYVKWAKICRDIMVTWDQKQIRNGDIELKNVYPLRFLKQTVACFFSLIGERGGAIFAGNYPELVQFVLDKEKTVLPNGFRFFLNLYDISAKGTKLRRWVNTGKISVKEHLIPVDSASFNEIAHPPFQLVMTHDNESYNNATEITVFQSFHYNQISNVEIPLRIVQSESPWPGAG